VWGDREGPTRGSPLQGNSGFETDTQITKKGGAEKVIEKDRGLTGENSGGQTPKRVPNRKLDSKLKKKPDFTWKGP